MVTAGDREGEDATSLESPTERYRVGGGIRILAPTLSAVSGYCGFQL
jgi:hypothetical protein